MGISVEIFDTTFSKPAVNMKINLFRAWTDGNVSNWEKIDEGLTDSNGYYRALRTPFASGRYKMICYLAQYYERQGVRSPHVYDEVS